MRLLGEKLNRLYENLIGDLLLQFSLMLTYFKLFICNEDSIVLLSIHRSGKCAKREELLGVGGFYVETSTFLG